MARYYPSQVPWLSKEERTEMRKFCREHFGRSFAEQCRYMLTQAKREQESRQKEAA